MLGLELIRVRWKIDARNKVTLMFQMYLVAIYTKAECHKYASVI